jgi:hypothetical protein
VCGWASIASWLDAWAEPEGNVRLPVLRSIAPLFIVYGATFLLAGVLPFVAGFLPDGIVQIMRGRGPKFFLASAAMPAGVAVIGWVGFQWGMGQAALAPSASSSASVLTKYFLPFSIPMSLLTFVIRTVQLLMKDRKRAAQSRKRAAQSRNPAAQSRNPAATKRGRRAA